MEAENNGLFWAVGDLTPDTLICCYSRTGTA